MTDAPPRRTRGRGRTGSAAVRARAAEPTRPVGTARLRGVRRSPRLTRARSRAGSVVAATSDLLGLSSTRRAALLAVVVCALALSVAVPLRNYVAQRQELAAVTERQKALAGEVEELTRERDRLADPAETEAQARTRLGYVRPGEIPFVVQLPGAGRHDQVTDPVGDAPWFLRLWTEVADGRDALPYPGRP
ncbi:MAG: septum formation initiator family protein [Dehalococcoidia bacterium]